MRILVTGATGYIGGRLVPRLLERGHTVRALARDAQRLRGRFDGAEIVEGSIGDGDALASALESIDCAYYLIHSMGTTSNFAGADRDAARAFGTAAKAAGVKRIVYLGGLGKDDEKLSPHLRSRHEVGDVLRESGVPVVEFRAALIIGSGSISFEMLRYLTERLPFMVAPKWVETKCQPIAIRDVLQYLLDAAGETTRARIYEIGGTDVLTYKQMMMRFAAIRGLKRHIVTVPLLTPQLSSYWVHLVTPISSRLAQPLIRGLHNEVVVDDPSALADFPNVHPIGFGEAVLLALDRYSALGPETTWFDAYDVRTLPDAFTGVREGVLIDRRQRETSASAQAVAAVFSALGGKRGWLVGNTLWELRGLMDRLVGGFGMRRGRRSETDLRVGDAVDFWRVDAFEPGKLLRLRAEMRLPGRAWLQFEVAPSGGGSTFRQTAFFEPRGLFGNLYWYAVALFHEWLFSKLASSIVRTAVSNSSAPPA